MAYTGRLPSNEAVKQALLEATTTKEVAHLSADAFALHVFERAHQIDAERQSADERGSPALHSRKTSARH